MVSEDEEWMKSALSDDSAVAELLLLLHRPPAAAIPSSMRLDWSVRQRRSSASDKGALRSPDSPGPAREKASKAEPTRTRTRARASPTTPLSWSGGTSSADGPEESSLPSAKLGSKVSSTVAIPSTKATTKRSRRKKRTLVELQEEESSLLKEQKSLRHELANLHVLIEKHRTMNERLKKLKLDLQDQRAVNGQEHHPFVHVPETERAKSREAMFELPDLNLPVEGS